MRACCSAPFREKSALRGFPIPFSIFHFQKSEIQKILPHFQPHKDKLHRTSHTSEPLRHDFMHYEVKTAFWSSTETHHMEPDSKNGSSEMIDVETRKGKISCPQTRPSQKAVLPTDTKATTGRPGQCKGVEAQQLQESQEQGSTVAGS